MNSPYLAVPRRWLSSQHDDEVDDFARRMAGAAPIILALAWRVREDSSKLTPDPFGALVSLPLRVRRPWKPSGARQGSVA